MSYIVARMHEGKPFDYLHEADEATGQMMGCTAIHAAKRFPSMEAASDAAGAAIDTNPHGSEYRALKAPTNSHCSGHG